MNANQIIAQGIQELKIAASEFQIAQLIEYNNLLIKTNKTHNLTGHKEPEKSAVFNILNSVAPIKLLQKFSLNEIADIGSGAGLPGIPWAILMPETKLFLIESRGKKADFAKTTAAALKLNNIVVMNKNLFEVQNKFKSLVFQAFGKIDKVLKAADFLIAQKGKVILYASSISDIEKGLKSSKINNFEILPFQVPFATDIKRNLVIFDINKGK